ncbi:MAG: 3-deoxy-manno-octulosonate cytidylyltransferase [Agarilytica sp.]
MKKFIVVIPARYASQRLPGKPLKDIAGKSMIQRVYNCAQGSAATRVIVATDDDRIENEVLSFSGEVVMTKPDHPSGTDRLQEVVTQLGLAGDDIVVNVQGDEPLIPAAVINQVAHNLMENPFASASTLSEPIADIDTVFNPNAVKVVADKKGRALYFSRAPIPWVRDEYSNSEPKLLSRSLVQRHIGIYGYRVDLLNQFVGWPLSLLESNEKLEQLRILENGCDIHVEEACEPVPGGVDTEEDLIMVQKLFEREN